MTRRSIRCLVLGHRWSRKRLPNRTVELICRRCGTVDVVEKDFDIRPGTTGGWL